MKGAGLCLGFAGVSPGVSVCAKTALIKFRLPCREVPPHSIRRIGERGGRPRRNHSAIYKAKVAVHAIKGEKTLAKLATVHDVHANQIIEWVIGAARFQRRRKSVLLVSL